MTSRRAIMVYAAAAYAAFAAVALWAIGFLANRGSPTRIDGADRLPAGVALLIDAGLLVVFAVQHSVMARAGFKRRLARVLPPAAERSTFVLVTSLVLLLLFGAWQPMSGMAWRIGAQPWAALLWVVYAAGWLIAVGATFMIDHRDFTGLRQAGWPARAGAYRPPSFTERWLYAWVRHPMMLGLLLAFWATPDMTAGHLFFAAAATLYIAAGVRLEERDLRRQLGRAYQDYARRVPAILPRPGQRPAGCYRRGLKKITATPTATTAAPSQS